MTTEDNRNIPNIKYHNRTYMLVLRDHISELQGVFEMLVLHTEKQNLYILTTSAKNVDNWAKTYLVNTLRLLEI